MKGMAFFSHDALYVIHLDYDRGINGKQPSLIVAIIFYFFDSWLIWHQMLLLNSIFFNVDENQKAILPYEAHERHNTNQL